MSFFATVPDSILGLLIGTFWMTVHIECFGIQPALSYCCHHFQLNKLCIAMISDKYDDHTSQSLHATPRNHERFFMAGSQATGAGIPCQRSMVPSCGSIEPLSPLSIWEKSQVFKPDFYGYFVIFLDSHWIPLASSTSHVPSRWRRWRFFDNFTKILMICSTLIPLAMGRGQGQGCDLIFLGPMGEGYRGWLSLDQGNVTWFRYGSVYVLVRKYIQMENL